MSAAAAVGGGIRELHLKDFKSWGGSQTIGPFRTFTCVIGSNGSGKSNLMDAISFVLGVRTAQLRGSQLGDLIHRAPDGTCSSSAYVELVYEDATADTIVFRRSISNNKSGYFVDGKPVKLGEYESRLSLLGVLVRARNFLVFQGDVESIAQKSPQELTTLFEQISGSDKMIIEYNQLQDSAKDAETAFLRSFDKKKGLAKEKRQIKEQKDEAERFQNLQQTYRDLRSQFFLWQLFHMDEDLASERDGAVQFREKVEQCQLSVSDAERSLADCNKKLGKMRRLKSSADRDVIETDKTIEAQQTKLIHLEEEKAYLSQQVEETIHTLSQAEQDFIEHKNFIKTLEKDLTKLNLELEAAENNSSSSDLVILDQHMSQYRQCQSEAAMQTTSMRKEKQRLETQIRMASVFLTDLQSESDSNSAHQTQLQTNLATQSERIQSLTQHIESTRQQLQSAQKEQQEIREASANSENRRNELQSELAQIERELLGVRVDRAESERETKFNAALVALQRLYPGVRGRLSSLCRPIQRKYHTAIAVALGKNINAIVVDTKRTALESIRYFKEQRIGAATFLPLDSLHVPSAAFDTHRHQTVRLVRDVIESDESIHKAILYACGNAIVADNLDQARHIAFDQNRQQRVKVVTLTGELLHKSGNMSGGAQRTDLDGGGVSSASHWDRSKLVQMKTRRDQLIDELAGLESAQRFNAQEHTVALKVSALSNQLKYSVQDEAATREKIDSLQDGLRDISDRQLQLAPRLETANLQVAKLQAELDAVNSQISKTERAIFAQFAKRIQCDNVELFEQRHVDALATHRDQVLSLRNQIARVESQIEYQKSRNITSTEIDRQKQSIKRRSKEVEHAQVEIDKLNLLLEDLSSTLSSQQALSVERKNDAEQLQTDLKRCKDSFSEVKEELDQLQSQLNGIEGECAKIVQRRRDMLQMCRLEQIHIPLVGKAQSKKMRKNKKRKKRGRHNNDWSTDDEEEEDDDEMDIDEQGIEPSAGMSSSQVDVQGIDHLDAPIDYSELRYEKDLDDNNQFAQLKAEYEDELVRLANDLENVAPNLKSFDKFDEVTGRLQSAADDFEAAKNCSKSAVQMFQENRQQRLEKFMEAYNHVSGKIDEVYKQLTRSQRFPLGGQAYLTLENPDNPFESGIRYHAMPPSKRFRDMDQLSGGEKTVAALALLFAIHSHHPSPFFVLDEVDAALDKTNVTKVARYVRWRAHEDNLQCIVISLKDTFFDKADSLVGVYKDRQTSCSGSITFDLSKYD